MKPRVLAASLAAGFAFATAASAADMMGCMTSPLQRSFWSYAGVTVGTVNYDYDCRGAGFACDKEANALKVFAGGRLNNFLGLDVGFLNLSEGQVGGGETSARGLNLSLLAGVPLGTNSSVFGKLGGTWARTKVTGNAPGFTSGTDNSVGPAYGFGAYFGLTDRIAFRLDVDRHRLKFENFGRENVDTVMLGLQASF
jgi:hypothetical protein